MSVNHKTGSPRNQRIQAEVAGITHIDPSTDSGVANAAGVEGWSAATTQTQEMTVVGSSDEPVRFPGRRTRVTRSCGTLSNRAASAAATKHSQKRPALLSARLTTAGGRFARVVEGLAKASAS